MKFFLLSIWVLLAPAQACRSSEKPGASAKFPMVKTFPLRDIANQTQEDITTILGPQSSLNAEDAKLVVCANCQKYSYQNDRIVIEYTNDMADRITIRPEARIKAEQVPALLGLKYVAPDSKSPNEVRWTQYGGIREVNAILTRDKVVRHILVKVLTDQ